MSEIYVVPRVIEVQKSGMRYMRFGEVLAEMDRVDDPDVLERLDSSPALRSALEMTRPRNWWGIGIDPLALFSIARDDGIPLAWVPRRSIITELAFASSRITRAKILQDRASEVVEDCASVVHECTDERLQDQAPLADAAIVAYHAGHREAALALAVSLGERLAIWASTPRVTGFGSPEERAAWEQRRRELTKYRWAEDELSAEPVDKRFSFLAHVVMAPIPRFFTPFRTERGDTIPDALSRHVVAHRPTTDHFTINNALVALMLMASLLRQQQAWCDELGPEEVDQS